MNEVKLVGKVAYVGQLKESAKGKKYLSKKFCKRFVWMEIEYEH